jgi:hypothetical protein
MQKLFLIAAALGLNYSAWAASCPPATLAAYESPTFSPCTVGTITDLTFSSFGYLASGTNPLGASSITVTPEQIGGEVGFIFSAPWGVLDGQSQDSKITYTAACDSSCSIDDWILQIAGAGSSGDGFINVAETAPEVTKGLDLSSTSDVITGNGSGTFAPIGPPYELNVTKDIELVGGDTPFTSTALSGVTNLLSVTGQTTMTPEPSLLFFCSGLVCSLLVAKRRLGRSK